MAKWFNHLFIVVFLTEFTSPCKTLDEVYKVCVVLDCHLWTFVKICSLHGNKNWNYYLLVSWHQTISQVLPPSSPLNGGTWFIRNVSKCRWSIASSGMRRSLTGWRVPDVWTKSSVSLSSVIQTKQNISFITVGTNHPMTWCHILGDLNPQQHSCENLKWSRMIS